MQYVGLGQQGFYEPFFYLGNRLAQTREFNLNKEKFEFAKSQEAPLNLATIAEKTAQTGLLKSLLTASDRKAAAEALEAENKAKMAGVQFPLVEARVKAGMGMLQNMMPPGVLPPEVPGNAEVAPAPEWRPPMKLQEPGSAPASPTPTQAPGWRPPMKLSAPGTPIGTSSDTVPYRPPTAAGTPQTRVVMGKEGMPEFQNLEPGLSPDEVLAVEEALASPNGQSPRMAALPENRAKAVQEAINLRKAAQGVKGEAARNLSAEAAAKLAGREVEFGDANEQQKKTTESIAFSEAFNALNQLADTIKKNSTYESTWSPWSDPQSAANLHGLPNIIGDRMTKLLSNPNAGTQPAVAKLYGNIPLGWATQDNAALAAIELQRDQLLGWIRGVENDPASRRPITGLTPEMREAIGPTRAYTEKWAQYDASLPGRSGDTSGMVEMVDPKGQVGYIRPGDVETQIKAGWTRKDTKGGLPPVSRKPRVDFPKEAESGRWR